MQKANTEFTKYLYGLQKIRFFLGAVCNPTNAKGKYNNNIDFFPKQVGVG